MRSSFDKRSAERPACASRQGWNSPRNAERPDFYATVMHTGQMLRPKRLISRLTNAMRTVPRRAIIAFAVAVVLLGAAGALTEGLDGHGGRRNEIDHGRNDCDQAGRETDDDCAATVAVTTATTQG